MLKKLFAAILVVVMVAGFTVGCGDDTEGGAPSGKQVTLNVVGAWEDCLGIDLVGTAFTAQNPNCKVVYEQLDNYNSTLGKRLSLTSNAGSGTGSGENSGVDDETTVDIFFTNNIQSTSAFLPYALDLYSRSDIDLSDTFDGLRENFEFRSGGSGTAAKRLYAIPVGAEMRGMYVNKTLLQSYDVAVPTNQQTLLAACAALKTKSNGAIIPMQGNPGSFATLLTYPWVANIIANADNYEEAYARVEAHEPGISEMFDEPLRFLYTLVQNGYYDYKVSQDNGLFNGSDDDTASRCLLNIVKEGNSYVKGDGAGKVAFMPSTISMQSTLDKMKEDYHSDIEYEFIPSPIGPDGGYVYISCAHGIAINKNSQNLDYAAKFIDFFFKKANNETFTSKFNVLPNNESVFEYINTTFDNMPATRISHLGEVTFSYEFYSVMGDTLIDIAKANNPKYMNGYVAGGANDNLTLYPLSKYVNELEVAFAAI